MKRTSNKFDQRSVQEQNPFELLAAGNIIDFDTSISGWKYILKYDRSVIRKAFYSFVVIGIVAWQQDWRMLLLMVVATGLMISAELFNTCIELICDYLTNTYDPRIKIIKDVSAASTNIAFLLWISLVVYEFFYLTIQTGWTGI